MVVSNTVRLSCRRFSIISSCDRFNSQGFPRWKVISVRQCTTSTSVEQNAHVPTTPARTRFAPSPTGYLHIGGLRTALFSYLLAKRTNGQFLLRIEDTDQKRLVSDAEQRLIDDLQWAGLRWDEGPLVGGPFGPYRQSERNDIYRQHAQKIIDTGSAYRCFCTPQTTKSDEIAYATSGCYQGCSWLPPEQSQERAESKHERFTVRLRQPANLHERTYKDLIFGKIQRLKRSHAPGPGDGDEAGLHTDTILVKSDGTPTYHFANVVDDHLMQITHVIRGSEWLASTPLHYDLYTAFGWEPPKFAHVGLLVDENHAKLSKRSTDGLVLDVRGMREQEFVLPESLCNFLVLLGWHNPNEDDTLDMTELIRDFSLKFTKKNKVVRMEKLWFLQKRHVRRRCMKAIETGSREYVADIAELIAQEVRSLYPNVSVPGRLEDYCAEVLLVDSKSYLTPASFVERNSYFFTFNSSKVPEQKGFYDQKDTISGRSLSQFLHVLLIEFDWLQPCGKATFPLPVSESKPFKDEHISTTNRSAARIHAAINTTMWQLMSHMYRENTVSNDIETFKVHDNEAFAFTTETIDTKACARYISRRRNADATDTEVEADAMVIWQQYQDWSAALMRYLREKLCYGMRGPGIGDIMALLGHEECCRRLGFKPKEKNEW